MVIHYEIVTTARDKYEQERKALLKEAAYNSITKVVDGQFCRLSNIGTGGYCQRTLLEQRLMWFLPERGRVPREAPTKFGASGPGSKGKRGIVKAVMDAGYSWRVATEAVDVVFAKWKQAVADKSQHIELPIGHLKVKKTPSHAKGRRIVKRNPWDGKLNSWTVYNDPYRIIWRTSEKDWEQLLADLNDGKKPAEDSDDRSRYAFPILMVTEQPSPEPPAAAVPPPPAMTEQEEIVLLMSEMTICGADAEFLLEAERTAGGRQRLLHCLRIMRRSPYRPRLSGPSALSLIAGFSYQVLRPK